MAITAHSLIKATFTQRKENLCHVLHSLDYYFEEAQSYFFNFYKPLEILLSQERPYFSHNPETNIFGIFVSDNPWQKKVFCSFSLGDMNENVSGSW